MKYICVFVPLFYIPTPWASLPPQGLAWFFRNPFHCIHRIKSVQLLRGMKMFCFCNSFFFSFMGEKFFELRIEKNRWRYLLAGGYCVLLFPQYGKDRTSLYFPVCRMGVTAKEKLSQAIDHQWPKKRSSLLCRLASLDLVTHMKRERKNSY